MAIPHHPYHPTKSQPYITIFLLLFLLLNIQIRPTLSLTEVEALLQFKKSLQNTTALDPTWSTTSTNPCGGQATWVGVLCDKNYVIGMRLESMGLSGKIDVEALSSLEELRSISFMDNKFEGSIPELDKLGSLKAIYLSSNQFSGEIPQDFFAHMNSLKKLWLPNNNFSGPIPTSLAKLKNLMELHLDNNQFSGTLPPFAQPPLVELNVSNNKLEGEIPNGLTKIDKSSFEGNVGLCGSMVGKECSKTPVVNDGKASGTAARGALVDGHDSSNAITAVATVFGAVFLMLLVLVFTMRTKKDENVDGVTDSNVAKSSKTNESERLVDIPLASPHTGSTTSSMASLNRKESSSMSGSGRKSNASRKGGSVKGGGGGATNAMGDLVMVNEEKGKFGLQDLMKAAAEVLGNGGMGSAYKAVMANGVSVTVKRTREMNRLGQEEFDGEMRKLSGLKHKNLLPPLAYYYRKEEKLLVYEYKPKKSLLYNIHGDGKNSVANLNWKARRKIINGIAQGLGFLHTKLSSSELPHGNLKSSNILIDDDYEPLMAKYGFCSVVSSNQMQQSLFAYKAPEVVQSQTVSHKCDVYCFGVVVLEILTGKFPSLYLPSNKSGVDVVQWVVSAIDENREAELLDPRITKESDHVDEMVALLRVGAACVEADPDARPDMFEAIRRVEKV
ncbi:hypothetical protein V2J09_003015 [Rumex salicifolius]